MDRRLRSLLSEDEREFIEEQLRKFHAATNRSDLASIANDPTIQTLERKYVPRLNENVAQRLKCDVLISTLGMRPQPIILTALILRPRRVFLLATEQSERQGREVQDVLEQEYQATGNQVRVRTLVIDETDVPQIYQKLRDEIISKVDPQRSQIVVDPTGGRKAMGVALAAFAMWHRIPMVYLLGTEQQGIIEPFSERLEVIENPYTFYGDPDRALVNRLFNDRNYAAALAVVQGLKDKETVGDVKLRGELEILEPLIQLYLDWDLFVHSEDQDTERRRLGSRLEKLRHELERFRLTFVDLDQLDKNLIFLKNLEESWRPAHNQADPYRLVDLVKNAERRARGGHYDDATARLYRCLEMSATLLLQEAGLSRPDRPMYNELCELMGGEQELQDQFQKVAQRPFPRPAGERPDVPLGLDAQMALLKIFPVKDNELARKIDNLTGIYKGLQKESLIDARNRSVLAHGTVPISQEAYEKLLSRVWAAVQATVGKEKARELSNQASHPELRW